MRHALTRMGYKKLIIAAALLSGTVDVQKNITAAAYRFEGIFKRDIPSETRETR